MTRRRRPATPPRLFIALLAGPLIVACSATPAETPTATPGRSATPAAAPTSAFSLGGTLRLVTPASDETQELAEVDAAVLDPQRSFAFVMVVLNRARFRTLVSYNGLSVEEGGTRLHPDIAEALPEVSADGLTWTVRLRRGLPYGPPLGDVEITARDFIRAFHRMFAPDVGGGFDFGDVEGAVEYGRGNAASISGLEAPDNHTLVIRLTKAQGDFGHRLASVIPLPPDPARPAAPLNAGAADDTMWRYFVSSGPYMVEGSEQLDLTAPPEQRRLPSGVGAGHIALVRNPSWDRASDALRPAYPDRIEMQLVDSEADAIARIDAGTADVLWNAKAPPSVMPDDFAAFRDAPARGHAYVNEFGGVRGLIMNVAVPPLDDVHVRLAMNWVVDKSNLVNIQGGPVAARVYGHLTPDAFLDGLLLDYDPFATAGGRGDIVKAKAEMALSRYDADGDGVCDAAACARIEALRRPAFATLAQAAGADFRKLGLGVEVRVMDSDAFFMSFGDAAARHALWLGLGFFNPFISATPWLTNFSGRRSIGDVGNGTMVGAMAEQLSKWGYEVTQVPNVDERVEACVPLIGPAQTQCWAGVDQYLMESVAPWVPYSQDRFAYLTGPQVVHVGFDEQATAISLDQFALAP